MEDFGSPIAYPTIEQVIDTNRRMIEEFGGLYLLPENCRNRSSLEHTLELVQCSAFGSELFPTLKEKAAALAYTIIASHVFIDGCKRTGIMVAYRFLAANRVPVFYDRTVVDIAISMATGNASRDDFLLWLHAHQVD